MSEVRLYFSKPGTKRNYPSTSDKSDNSICSEASVCSKQEWKHLNTVASEDDTDMAVQAALDQISQHLDTLATRTDADQMRVEVNNLTQTFIKKFEKLEGRLFDMETKTDKIKAEVKAEKKRLKSSWTLWNSRSRDWSMEREQNDEQQYTRCWNLQAYKVPKDKAETADDCIEGMQNLQWQSQRPSQHCWHRGGSQGGTAEQHREQTHTRQILWPQEEGQGSQQSARSQKESICCYRRYLT